MEVAALPGNRNEVTGAGNLKSAKYALGRPSKRFGSLRRYLENDPASKPAVAASEIATQRRRAEQIAPGVHNQTGFWESAVLAPFKDVQHRFLTGSIQLEYC